MLFISGEALWAFESSFHRERQHILTYPHPSSLSDPCRDEEAQPVT